MASTMEINSGAELVHIGTLASRVGLSLRTVRYYEEVGLCEPAARTTGGFRLYGSEQEERLLVLKAMKPLGFSLDEMREIVTLLDDTLRVRAGSRRAVLLLERMTGLQQEIHLRHVNLLKQLEATAKIKNTLDNAVEGLKLMSRPPGSRNINVSA